MKHALKKAQFHPPLPVSQILEVPPASFHKRNIFHFRRQKTFPALFRSKIEKIRAVIPHAFIGVDLAKTKIERAELILAVFDGSAELDESDKDILSLCKGRDVIGIINKTDLESRLNKDLFNGLVKINIFLSFLFIWQIFI